MENASKKGILALCATGLLVSFFTVFAAEAAQYIGMEKAKSIALTHAGLSESELHKLKVELDRRKNHLVYEVEFEHGGMEYEYKIDAVTGDILRRKAEWD
ncbi:MAG: PepSY domain-containing protein [Synergistaceae bacterium]|nr:PepSY domain-containing protein [Synergistaceae bacterium]